LEDLRVLSTDIEMIPGMDAIDAHAQGYVANDELLIAILKTFAQCTGSLHATRNARSIQCVCGTRTVFRPVTPPVANSSPHRARHAHLLANIISLSVVYRVEGITIDLKQITCEDVNWIRLAQDINKLQTIVKTVTNFRVA
jgi:hypothetical protein